MQKELSMTSNTQALLIGTGAIVVALLAVLDVVPATVAQMLPVAMVPFIIKRRRNPCAVREC
jgi:hypothetical protein